MQINPSHHQPHKSIAHLIEGYWFLSTPSKSDGISQLQRCTPRGTCELFFNLKGAAIIGTVGDRNVQFPPSFYTGIMTEPITWQMYGDSVFLCITIRPEALIRLTCGSIAHLINEIIPFTDNLLKDINTEVNKIKGVSSEIDCIKWLDDYFCNTLSAPVNPKIDSICNAITRCRLADENFDINKLKDSLSVCERQTQRIFKAYLGLSPKSYSSLVRFGSAATSVLNHTFKDWMTLAEHLGYSDQAHFIREFRRFSGVSPGFYLQELKS